MEHAIMPFKGDRSAVVVSSKNNVLKSVKTNDTAPNPYLEDAGLETDPDKV
jgi:hypothetical protein